MQLDANSPAGGLRRLGVDGLARDAAQVHLAPLRLDSARLQPREREQVLGEHLQLVGALADAQREPSRGLRLVGGSFGEHLGGGADRGDRVLQLVREVGDEVLQRVALLQLAPHRLQRLGQLAHLPPARPGQRRLPLARGDALRCSGQPLDGTRHRLADEHRHHRRREREDEGEKRHFRGHVVHQRHHAEGGLAHAHESLVADGRAGHHDLHSGAVLRLSDRDHRAALRVDDLDVRCDLAVGERGQDARELLGRVDQFAASRVQLA